MEDLFHEKGNCIGLALARITDQGYLISSILTSTPTTQGECQSDYFSGKQYSLFFQKMSNTDFRTTFYPEFHNGTKWLVHVQTKGRPHCMAIAVGGGLVCRIYNNRKVFYADASELYGIIQASVDKKLMVFFEAKEGNTLKDYPLTGLRNLRAGVSGK